MNIHQNAGLTPIGRERIVRAILEGGQTPQAAARAAGVCPRTARASGSPAMWMSSPWCWRS
jgi:hypothetical protein